MHWEIEELITALDDGNIGLAKRYAGKIHAYLFCPICKQEVYFNEEGTNHFKGRAHKKCLEN